MSKKLIDDIKNILDKPLEDWSNGYLKFEVASMLNDPNYIAMLDYEKEDREYPISRDEMIKYLRLSGKYK